MVAVLTGVPVQPQLSMDHQTMVKKYLLWSPRLSQVENVGRDPVILFSSTPQVILMQIKVGKIMWYTWQIIKDFNCKVKYTNEAREMVQILRAFIALAKDMFSVPSNHVGRL